MREGTPAVANGGCPRVGRPVIDSTVLESSDILLDEFGDCEKGAGGWTDAIQCPVSVVQSAA